MQEHFMFEPYDVYSNNVLILKVMKLAKFYYLLPEYFTDFKKILYFNKRTIHILRNLLEPKSKNKCYASHFINLLPTKFDILIHCLAIS